MVREVGNNLRRNWSTYLLIAIITAVGTSVGNSLWNRFTKIAATPEQVEELKVLVIKFSEESKTSLVQAVEERNRFLAKVEAESKERDGQLDDKYQRILSDHREIRRLIPYMEEHSVERGRREERAK